MEKHSMKFLLYFLSILVPSHFYNITNKYLVVLHDEGDEFHGFGVVANARVVLTSCHCVGRFEGRKGGLYEFQKINKTLTAVTYDGGSRGVDSIFVHGHCRPTEFDDLYIYDLGALRVSEPFDDSFKISPPKDRIEDIKKKKPQCFSFSYAKDVETIHLELIDSKKCAVDFCKAISSKINCSNLYPSVIDESVECSKFNMSPTNVLGSPVVCQNQIWGVVSNSTSGFVLWSRIDIEPNKNFFDELKSSSGITFMSQTIFIICCLQINGA